ncbi:related to VPS41 - required for the vacuolar assembly [Cephalotrichum gorgonifer]|uniref:Related to VPS41 - required for the vacuolar assembly n=1 Tax=Cephalotrichum gorgonifer TaxID=2041049 RepID=A0AAE8MUR8_9PEZI|nr:related to VPS41 - required for the vacuolar assembly [Cephalotrichum gorgonifer]
MTEDTPVQQDDSPSRDDSSDVATSADSRSAKEDKGKGPAREDDQSGSGEERPENDTQDNPTDSGPKADANDEGNTDEESEGDEEEDSDEEDEDDEDEEPKLKYARLTQHLGPVYRNGDATSSFLVAGDKMIVGTHNGNINVVQLPHFQPLRVYHAHAASVTAISISPYPPPLPSTSPEASQPITPGGEAHSRPPSIGTDKAAPLPNRRRNQPPPIPNTPSNNIYIATSSMDGNVCVQNLVDLKDVQLRNFARPVQAVALSPEYKSDRTYLSGGLAGNLILTVGGQPGRSVSTTIGTAAATASGWLGSMGLGTNTGKDTILHSGEGTISTIKWSLSGKYVAWLNEHGIKIMRTKHKLDSADSDDAWQRLGHIDRPQTEEWDEMASVWKGRVEWIDEQALESDEMESEPSEALTPTATDMLRRQSQGGTKAVERLLVGWGGTIWIIHVLAGGIGVGTEAGERSVGKAEIVNLLHMDCIISGISLYSQKLLLVLAYCLPEDEDEDEDTPSASTKGHRSQSSVTSTSSEPKGGIRRRQNNQPPELRLIDLESQAEVDKDGLTVSRYERLTSGDYHLGVLPARNAASAVVSHRGALGAIAGLGSGMWNAAINPRSLFDSGASIMSRGSGDDAASGSRVGSVSNFKGLSATVHPSLVKPGAKVFIHSPYDCILATKRDLADHLTWILEHHMYKQAWELLDESPEILAPPTERSLDAIPSAARAGGAEEFFDDASSVTERHQSLYTSAAKEKRRIGELWIQDLVEAGDWATAGQVCGRVLNTPDRWEKWVWTFAGAKKFDEIVNHMPAAPMTPPAPKTIYEVVLGHYIQTDKLRFRDLLERWPTELFDVGTIATALENQLTYRDVREDSVEDGEKGRDWRIVVESLAKLHEASGRHREALRCYIKLQDADSAFRLIRDFHLADAVADDIPKFIGLRVSQDRFEEMSPAEFEEATAEAITLLVDEAQHGLVRPGEVVAQLEKQRLDLYLFFYLRGLWKGEGCHDFGVETSDRLLQETKSLVDEFGDLAVRLFAKYDRDLLMEYLKTSTSYTFEKAVQECEQWKYDDELVYLYSKTGQMKRALYLIIDRLKNVKKAIYFAKEQGDPDLWEDLLDYSMDKPSFIRGLLEQVGTAINPITLVRRIPEGLEIHGLREGIRHIMKEHEIQYSISEGVAKVLRSEVVGAQAELRRGQRRGIKFEVPAEGEDDQEGGRGACARCKEPFNEFEEETLVGFACRHVFHLGHLFEDENTSGAGVEVGGEEYGGRHLVGMKVTRARLLRERIRGGCPLCIKR